MFPKGMPGALLFSRNELADFGGFDMHKGMPKETPNITKNKWMEEPLTRGKMEPIIVDLKDFIRATARGTENVLRKEIEGTENVLRKEIEGTENVLRKEIENVRTELTEKINDVRTELSKKINGVHTELSEKMDRVISKVDSNEEKIETHLTAHP